jgi:hypothetical protein
MLPALTVVVCEDGTEYIDRFRRFLAGLTGPHTRFVPAHDYAEAKAAAAGAQGILLDLDFRRTAADRLVDEHGPVPTTVEAARRARLAESQGILILRRLRAEGIRLPAILFADLDDQGQARFLESTLAPLVIASGRLGLPEIAALVRAFDPAADA